jgi:FkbM family methyltransferase
MLSIYHLKNGYRRVRKHLPINDALARRVYHRYIDLLLASNKGDTFRDVYGLLFNLDRNSLLERQMAAAGYWEEDTKALIDNFVHAGDTVVEVGANFGGHTLPLAHKVGPEGRVIAFEPTEYGYDRLMANMRLNPHLRNIEVHKRYLSETDNGEVEVMITSRWAADGIGSDTRLSRFTSVTLDSVLGTRPVHVLKIDVDGAEQSVLNGARHTITSNRPVLYVEVSGALTDFRSPPEEVCKSLQELGYVLHVYRSGARKLVPIQPEEVSHLLHAKPVLNVLGLHI